MRSVRSTTLAVQSLHVALEFPPLQANTVGQLLPGVHARPLRLLFTGLKHFLLVLRVCLHSVEDIMISCDDTGVLRRFLGPHPQLAWTGSPS